MYAAIVRCSWHYTWTYTWARIMRLDDAVFPAANLVLELLDECANQEKAPHIDIQKHLLTQPFITHLKGNISCFNSFGDVLTLSALSNFDLKCQLLWIVYCYGKDYMQLAHEACPVVPGCLTFMILSLVVTMSICECHTSMDTVSLPSIYCSLLPLYMYNVLIINAFMYTCIPQ